jgi:hypothetical protein
MPSTCFADARPARWLLERRIECDLAEQRHIALRPVDLEQIDAVRL